MKKLALLAMLFAASVSAKDFNINYDCDYTLDGHEYTEQIEYNAVTEALTIGGKVHGQDFRSVLNYKSRYQFFKNTALIRDRFTGKMLSNSHEITNLQCEIYGA